MCSKVSQSGLRSGRDTVGGHPRGRWGIEICGSKLTCCEGWGGEQLQVRWVLPHLNVEGNEAVDELAGKGRELHPNNLLSLSKRRRVTEWDALDLEPMAETSGLEAGPEVDSGGGSSSDTRSTSSSGSGESLSALSCSGSDGEEPYSTDVSDTRLGRATGTDSDEFSTDVSDSRKRRRREGGVG